MLCNHCKKNTATCQGYLIINGRFIKADLCSECGRASLSLTQNIFTDSYSVMTNKRKCKTCGTSFSRISDTKLLGCSDCYKEFKDILMPQIEAVQGGSLHGGKAPRRR